LLSRTVENDKGNSLVSVRHPRSDAIQQANNNKTIIIRSDRRSVRKVKN